MRAARRLWCPLMDITATDVAGIETLQMKALVITIANSSRGDRSPVGDLYRRFGVALGALANDVDLFDTATATREEVRFQVRFLASAAEMAERLLEETPT